MFAPVNPEDGFTSDVIRSSRRFVGRRKLIEDCIASINSTQGLIAVFGKRGVGKSSLLRQIQAMALGDFSLPQKAGLYASIPKKARKYYTVYYQCDALIRDAGELIVRLCNDTDPEDGLLRLVPDQGKELVEFSRSDESSLGLDLKVANWGSKGTDLNKYSYKVQNDPIQTFRNFVSSVVGHNNRAWSKRDSVLILLDEFDQIQDKRGLGSLIKSLTNPSVKFGICGVGRDLSALIADHASVGRLVQQGALHVQTMEEAEVVEIFSTAHTLFGGRITFDHDVVTSVARICEGYPYFAQLIGKACVEEANRRGQSQVRAGILDAILDQIRTGKAFPHLEREYAEAVGHSHDRAALLALLAEQDEDNAVIDTSGSYVHLKEIRSLAKELDVDHLDQNLPRLVDPDYGPVLVKDSERPGVYEFLDPVFRAYVKLRRIGSE